MTSIPTNGWLHPSYSSRQIGSSLVRVLPVLIPKYVFQALNPARRVLSTEFVSISKL